MSARAFRGAYFSKNGVSGTFRTRFLVVKMVVRAFRGGHFSKNRVPGTLRGGHFSRNGVPGTFRGGYFCRNGVSGTFRTPFLVVKMVVRTLGGGHFSENRVPGTLERIDKRSNCNGLYEIEGQKPQNSDLRFTIDARVEEFDPDGANSEDKTPSFPSEAGRRGPQREEHPSFLSDR